MKISHYAFVAVAGASLTLSLAPFDWWWTAIIAMAALAASLNNATAKQGFMLGWSFGSASFATGVSWVYVAMHDFGGTSVALAIPMTALFCIGLGLVPALLAYILLPLDSRWYRR